jgi:hypothetical protein
VTAIHVAFGPHDFRFTIPDLDEHPELLRIVLKHVPRKLNIGKIKRRFSNTQQRAYVSNGCIHCDSIVGQFFEHDVYDVEEPLCRFPIAISEQWRRAITMKHDGSEPGWGIYPDSGGSPDWLKFRNPAAPAVKWEAEEDWGKRR